MSALRATLMPAWFRKEVTPTSPFASPRDHADAAAPSSAVPRDAEGDALLRRIMAHDEVALRECYQRYGAVVFGLALHMLHDRPRAEEATQDTFVRVWRMAHTFDPERGQAERWIVAIARNVVLGMLRHVTPAEASIDDAAQLVSEGDDPEEAAWVNARRQIVRDALAHLPEAQRAVVLLAYFEGLTQNEIAQRLGEPLGTVKSRLRLALRRLHALLRRDPDGVDSQSSLPKKGEQR